MGKNANLSKKNYNEIEKAVNAIDVAVIALAKKQAVPSKELGTITAKVDKINVVLEELRAEYE